MSEVVFTDARSSKREKRRPVTYKPQMSAKPKSKRNPRKSTRVVVGKTKFVFNPLQYTKKQMKDLNRQKTARNTILRVKRRSAVPPRTFAQNMLWALPRSPPKNAVWPRLPKKTKDILRTIPEFAPFIRKKNAEKRAEDKAKRNMKAALRKQEAKLKTQGQAMSRAARAQRKPERVAASLKAQQNEAMKQKIRKKTRLSANKLAELLEFM